MLERIGDSEDFDRDLHSNDFCDCGKRISRDREIRMCEDCEMDCAEMESRALREWRNGGAIGSNREKMRRIVAECLTNGLPFKHEWIDKREEIAGKFIDELEIDTDKAGKLADEFMVNWN